MPRGARIDTPGMFHHVMFRGIEKRRIFLSDRDRNDFLTRLQSAVEGERAFVFAWCLMSNHAHLAIRTGTKPLSAVMSAVLSGYATAFNLRRKRNGHLLQNRYKSIVVDEEQYFLALVRYIHRNPIRARVVSGIEDLDSYEWTGHSVLMGKQKRSFQEVDEVFARFGKTAGPARRELRMFMNAAEAKGDEKVFKSGGGGLIRSIGGLSKLEEHRKGPKWASDERVLGNGDFVEAVLKRAQTEPEIIPTTPEQRREAYKNLLKNACAHFEVDEAELTGGSKRRQIVTVRQFVSYVALRKIGLPTAAIARTMNLTGPAISRAASKGREIQEQLKLNIAGLLE